MLMYVLGLVCSVSLRPLRQEHVPGSDTLSLRRLRNSVSACMPDPRSAPSSLRCGPHTGAPALARFFRFRGLRSGSSRGRADQALRSHSLRGL
ncbi:MAG TPA: hypothetical protein VNW04_12835 [Puia sp.]|nr:hypothetical protein [Puia sp.]